MPTVLPKRIDLRVHELADREGVAGGAIVPGDLIRCSGVDASSGLDTVVVHATADGQAAKKFALQRLYNIKSGLSADSGAGANIDTPYALGEHVCYRDCEAGDMIYARLAVSQTIAVGDFLVSAGNGQLRKVHATAATSLTIIGIAKEAVTTTGAVGRIVVEII